MPNSKFSVTYCTIISLRKVFGKILPTFPKTDDDYSRVLRYRYPYCTVTYLVIIFIWRKQTIRYCNVSYNGTVLYCVWIRCTVRYGTLYDSATDRLYLPNGWHTDRKMHKLCVGNSSPLFNSNSIYVYILIPHSFFYCRFRCCNCNYNFSFVVMMLSIIRNYKCFVCIIFPFTWGIKEHRSKIYDYYFLLVN